MNSKVAVVVAAVTVVVIAGAAWWFFGQQPQSQSSSTETSSPSSSTQPSETAPEANVVEVSIEDFKYAPAQLTIKKGTKVVWTNKDSAGHNVVSDNSAPAGGPPKQAALFGKGEQFSFTYDVVGTFGYHCTPHPSMTGQVIVTE